ncbi:MAG: maleylpyruvate isomerase N-terminal domain-containing protein [Candidatus Limnocylindria bacterium]
MTDPVRSGIDPAELALERHCWDELSDLIDTLSAEQVVRPGYFPDGWSVKDMLGHIGTWMAEAGMVLEQIRFGTYGDAEIDIDALNARFLEANAASGRSPPGPSAIIRSEEVGLPSDRRDGRPVL